MQPKLQVGRLSNLWVAFAKFYEEGGQLDDVSGFPSKNNYPFAQARSVFEKALQAPYSKVDELAMVWCEFAELEIRHK